MRKFTTEFIGTFFLVMGAAQAGALGASLALMGMIYAGGHISGAHYNPAVSLSFLIRGRMTIKEMLGYWVSQLAGALAAAMVVMYLFKAAGTGSCAVVEDNVAGGLAAELLGTLALAYVVLNVATAKNTDGNSFYGIAIAGTVMAMALVVGKYSGGAFNPAVAIGLALQKSLCWSQLWIYLVGSIAGATLAALLFNMNNPDDK